MEISDHAREFMQAHLLLDRGNGEFETPESFFHRLATVLARYDKELEPKADEGRTADRFFEVMSKFRFLPAFHWLKYFATGEGGELDEPVDHLGESMQARTSVADSEVLQLLESESPFQVEVPSTFLRALDSKSTWPIHYRHEPNAAVEVAALPFWEALRNRILSTGQPVFHFPQSLKPASRIQNPPGPMVRGAINLASMVGTKDGMPFLDWKLLVKTIVQAVRMMDALVLVAEEVRQDGYIRRMRRIGLGLVGWGEALVKLTFPYGCEEALQLGSRLMEFVQAALQEASAALARYRSAVEGATVRIRGREEPVRNLCRTYVLPEDELAFLMGTTPGLEPLPGVAGKYVDYVEGKSAIVVNPHFSSFFEEGIPEPIMDQLLDEGILHEDLGLQGELLDVYTTRTEIEPHILLNHQLTFQKFCDDVVALRIRIRSKTSCELIDELLRTSMRRGGRGLWLLPDHINSGIAYQLGVL